MRCMVLSLKHQRVAARILEEVLVYDYPLGKRAAISPWMEEVFRRALSDEAELRSRQRSRQKEIEGWVACLEGESIQSGKKEDLGAKLKVS